jgi:hypothetical protein
MNVNTNHCVRHGKQFCGAFNEKYTSWPHLMKPWQYVLVGLSNIAICELGFSKQNAKKSHVQALLKFDIWML